MSDLGAGGSCVSNVVSVDVGALDVAIVAPTGGTQTASDEVQVDGQTVEIDLRLDAADRDSRTDLEDTRVRLPDGRLVPLLTVARIEEGRGFARIHRIDGIPTWRVYLSIVLPMLRPTIITAVVLMSLAVIKSYDLVVALTNGGPGLSTDVPAKFIMDFLFERSNIGLATAACTMMLLFVLLVFTPWFYFEYFREKGHGQS